MAGSNDARGVHGAGPSRPPAAARAGYRDELGAAHARALELERRVRELERENSRLVARLSVSGPLARIDDAALAPDARRRLLQRRIRAVRRELRAAFGVRRYATAAVLGVTAAAAFIVLAADSFASWPLALAILGMGVVARGLVEQWPGFSELEERRRKLAALKTQLDLLREHDRPGAAPHGLARVRVRVRDEADAAPAPRDDDRDEAPAPLASAARVPAP